MENTASLRQPIDRADVLAAIDLFEREFEDDPTAVFSLGTITNTNHALEPWGSGVAVSVHAPAKEGPVAAGFGKDCRSFLTAMERAIRVVRSRREVT